MCIRDRCRYTPDENPFVLTGVLRCGNCDSPLWGIKNRSKSNKTQARRYECSKRRREGKQSCEGCTVGESVVLYTIVEWITEEFFPTSTAPIVLKRLAKNRSLKDPIPGFEKLRRMLFGSRKRKTDQSRLLKQRKTIESKLAKARRNILLIDDPETVEVAQEQIQQWVKSRDDLTRQLESLVTEDDINSEVLEVLGRLADLSRPNDDGALRHVLRALDRIVIHTEARGSGSARRYTLTNGEIHFLSSTYRQQQSEP